MTKCRNPRIIARREQPRFQANNCEPMETSVRAGKEMRDAIAHASPGMVENIPSQPSTAALEAGTMMADLFPKLHTFVSITLEEVKEVVDAVVAMIRLIHEEIDSLEDLHWLRDQRGGCVARRSVQVRPTVAIGAPPSGSGSISRSSRRA